jgi:hypothetical protein
MDLFLYQSRTDNSINLANFQIFNIAKIGYVLRANTTLFTSVSRKKTFLVMD